VITISRALGAHGLPTEILGPLLIASVSNVGFALVGPTACALILAHRRPQDRLSTHWAVSVAVGLVLWPVAMLLSPRFDMINAVQDGESPSSSVMHPTPEERIELARTLPACPFEHIATKIPRGWRWQTVRPVAARLPMPAEMHEPPDQVPDDPLQQWESERWGTIDLMLDGSAQQSTGFVIGGGSAIGGGPEASCGLRIGSRLSLVRRAAYARQHTDGTNADSTFVAMTDIPIALPDTQLGVGIIAHTRAARDSLLSVLASIRFVERQ